MSTQDILGFLFKKCLILVRPSSLPQEHKCAKPQLKIINFEILKTWMSPSILLRQMYQGFRYESVMPLYIWKVT